MPFDSNRRATARVRSVDPSSTTTISFRCHVWAIADRRVSAIQSCALYAGIRIETNGCIIHPSQQPRVHVPRHLTDHVPGMSLRGVIADLLPVAVQVGVEFAREVAFDVPREVSGIFSLEYIPCFVLDDVLPQSPYVGSDYGQAKAIPQKKNTALVDMGVRED